MKKLRNILACAAVLALLGSCSDDMQTRTGMGRVAINASIDDDMKVVSRTVSETELASLEEGATVWISQKDKGLVRKYHGLANVPASIDLMSGSYIAEVWAGDSVPASWDTKWYKAYVPFQVNYGETTPVEVVCKIANAAVTVTYPEGIETLLSDITMTVKHPKTELTFVGVEDAVKTAYFMMPSYSHELEYTLTGTQINGEVFTFSDKISDVQGGMKYNLLVECDPRTEETGGAFFNIVVEEEPIGEEKEVLITLPPTIKGYGFDINEPQIVRMGEVERTLVHIASAIELTDVLIESDDFIPFLNYNDVDVLKMSDAIAATLAENGFNIKKHEVEEGTLLQLNFEEELLNKLLNGIHTFKITATDNEGQVSTRVLTLNVTSASTQVVPAEDADITPNSITLRGRVLKEGVEKVGFNWRKAGESDWNYVEGAIESRSFEVGAYYSATVTGLEESTAYEYAAVADDYMDNVQSISTKSHKYLPNGGFEDWSEVYDAEVKKNVWVPCANDDGSDMFWDSGNHGSMKTNENVTTYDETVVHSGKRSIKLESKYPSVFGIGKFAAGNIFTGKYLKTDGTDGVLGWGREWPANERPKGLKGYVKYKPVTIDKGNADKGYPNGSMDKGLIKIALLKGTMTENGEDFGFIVKTKNSSSIFEDDGEYVVALGKMVLTEDTGEEWLEFDIPLEDVHPGEFTRLLIVASSSMGGDYFAGGVGSTMWLDDIQVYY